LTYSSRLLIKCFKKHFDIARLQPYEFRSSATAALRVSLCGYIHAKIAMGINIVEDVCTVAPSMHCQADWPGGRKTLVGPAKSKRHVKI
jgi:hypothetical protein